jgi:hypothetical protein
MKMDTEPSYTPPAAIAATGVRRGQRGHDTLIGARHHAPLLSSGHVTVVVAIGALLCVLAMAFAVSWRDSGDRLHRILSEFDGD